MCMGSALCAAQTPRQMPTIVRQVDHILVASSEAKKLFSLLTDTFQLPVAWPMSDYGNFASGGVAVGNVNLEIIMDLKHEVDGVKARWTGFALEPEPLRISLPELRERGLQYGTPSPFWSKKSNGTLTKLWTTVGLPEVSSDDVHVFFCQYEDDPSTRRHRMASQLRSRNGGPLSINSVGELIYGVKDAKGMQRKWQKLLSPLPASTLGAWKLGTGPGVRLVEAEQDRIKALVVNVNSLEQARRFLKEQNLLGIEQSAQLMVSGPQLEDLGIMLVEQPSKGSRKDVLE